MPSASKIPLTVNDFTVLPLQIPEARSFPIPATHYLYLRQNAPSIPTEDNPRELFLVNIPIDTTETHLRSLFAEQLGGARIESVAFELARVGKGITAPIAPQRKRKRDQDGSGQEVGAMSSTWDRELHRSGSTAVVTFIDKPSAEMAIREARKASKAGTKIVWGRGIEDKVPALGLQRYLTHQKLRYPPMSGLQKSVDDYMQAFSQKEAETARLLAKQRSEPDEDGFVTVVRGGRVGAGREEEAKAKGEELKQREKDRAIGDFYRFQVRERKKEDHQKFLGDFENDQRKVEELRKKKNKFRPD